MQIVPLDDLYEMSNPIFYENKKIFDNSVC